MNPETRAHVTLEPGQWDRTPDRLPIASEDLDRGQEVCLIWHDERLLAYPRFGYQRDGVAHHAAKEGERVLVAASVILNDFGTPIADRVWCLCKAQIDSGGDA